MENKDLDEFRVRWKQEVLRRAAQHENSNSVPGKSRPTVAPPTALSSRTNLSSNQLGLPEAKNLTSPRTQHGLTLRNFDYNYDSDSDEDINTDVTSEKCKLGVEKSRKRPSALTRDDGQTFSIINKLLNSKRPKPGNGSEDAREKLRVSWQNQSCISFCYDRDREKTETLLDQLIADIDEITEIPFFDIKIPREVAVKIFQHLDVKDLCNCSQVFFYENIF